MAEESVFIFAGILAFIAPASSRSCFAAGFAWFKIQDADFVEVPILQPYSVYRVNVKDLIE